MIDPMGTKLYNNADQSARLSTSSKFVTMKIKFLTREIPMLALALAIVLSGMLINSCIKAECVSMSDVQKLSLRPTREMSRADLYMLNKDYNPRAVIVLCPGLNGNGEHLINQLAWQEFSRANHLALCGVSFASTVQELQSIHGYIHAERGSGDLLLKGLRLGFGKDLPIFIYGFSCGARFAASLVAWRPMRVLAWCSYSTTWWEEPQALPVDSPPGIIACGEEDAANYGSSTTFFAKGRAVGLRCTWLSLVDTNHVWSEPLDDFVRVYFKAILDRARGPSSSLIGHDGSFANAYGVWKDVDTKQTISDAQVASQPVLACWLPNASIVGIWANLHRP